MPTVRFRRVKELQSNLMTAEALPIVISTMGDFFPIWFDLLRRIVHCNKKFSKKCYPTNPRCSARFHWIAMNLFTEYCPYFKEYVVSCWHLGLRQHHFESYELVVRAFMHMMSAMPSKFVNEICYLIQNTLFEPSFERVWKFWRSEDRARQFDPYRRMSPEDFGKKYAVINALESFYNFVTNLYPVPRQILGVKLIRWNNYFVKFGSRQLLESNANITSQKRLKMLLMSGMVNKLVIRLFYSRGIFPLSSQLDQIYSKNFGEVMHKSFCRKMKALPKEVPKLDLRKITASHFRKLCELANIKAFKHPNCS